MSYSLNKRISLGLWEVYCVRCATSIGTMKGDVLRQAIINTAHKGGVMCPQCRANSCRKCGVEVVNYTEQEQEQLDDFRECWYCRAEMEDAIREVESGSTLV